MIDSGNLKAWRFIHKRATGEYVGLIERIFDWDCSRAENEKGSFSMSIAPDYLNDFLVDDIIEFRRSTDGGRSFKVCDDTCWFVRDADYTWENGHEMIRLSGHDTTGLLERRIVAWFASVTNMEGLNTYGHKSEPADSILWDIFNENFGAGVVGLTSTDVPPSAGGPTGTGVPALDATPSDRIMVLVGSCPQTFNAPLVDLEISWKNCLATMKDVASSVAKFGTRLLFDIVYTPEAEQRFTFQIWNGRRGEDTTLRDRPVVFSLEHENVSKVTLRRQYSDEVTWVHSLGSGQGSLRVTQGALAPNPAFRRSPFYPIEAVVENTKTAAYQDLRGVGNAELYRHRARNVMALEAKDGPHTIYGRDYQFGDLVCGKHRGSADIFRVSKVRIGLKGGQETLSLPLELDALDAVDTVTRYIRNASESVTTSESVARA